MWFGNGNDKYTKEGHTFDRIDVSNCIQMQ